MILQIRNMETSNCISMVKREMNRLGLNYKTVNLGEVEIREDITEEKWHLIDNALRDMGLEIISDKNALLINKIKDAIYELVYLSDDLPKPNFSEYLSKKVYFDYNYLSNFFSGQMGITIEKYIIALKIERIKELLVHDKLNLNEIAYKLHYSSVAHLSNQFKKVTGLTPSFFKQYLT